MTRPPILSTEKSPHPIEAGTVFLAFLLIDWALKRCLVEWWLSRQRRRLAAELAGYLTAAADG